MPKKDLYKELFEDVTGETQESSDKVVPNLFPTIHSTPYKIAIIGEAPGTNELDQGKPFVGYSGQRLDEFLSRFGLVRDACFLGNICQHQPPGNKIAYFSWDGSQIQGGLQHMATDLAQLKTRPNVLLLLGGSALHAFKAPHITPKRKKNKKGELSFAFPNKIGQWRGSFFISHDLSPLPGVKCIASYHPAYCLRDYEWTPVLMLDIERCRTEAESPEWEKPLRQLRINLTFDETCRELLKLILHKPLVACDIEGGVGTMSCISFATAANEAFIVPFTRMDGTSFWNLEEEVKIWELLIKVLSDSRIKKVLQNSLYDRFVLQYGYKVVVKGVIDDTLVKHWELYCEMRKSLAFLASIYTKEPYWKEMRIQAEQQSEEEGGEE